jgi:gluconolactonase
MRRSPGRLVVFVSCAAVAVAVAPAQVTIHHGDGGKLIDPKVEIERLSTGHGFLEGPVWREGGTLVFSDIPKNQWLVWSPQDGVRFWKDSAGANGNTLDREGRLLSCQHEARNVVRHEPAGGLTVLVDRHDGQPFHSPNDLVVHPDGSLWFTDPTYGLRERPRGQPGNFVYRFDPASRVTTVVQREFDQPNGLCFSPDHQRLWIADSGRKERVGAFPVAADGTLGPATLWIEGGADGLRCDESGNVYLTARDGVRIHAQDGRHLVTITLPEQPANCAFGGADRRSLFVTARRSLYRVALTVAGAPPVAAPPPPPPPKAPTGRGSLR